MKIECKTKTKKDISRVRVRIVKPPLVDMADLRSVIWHRARAVVL